MVVQPLQAGGDPAEFLVLLWSSRIVFNKANKPAVGFLDLYPGGHQAHDLVDPTPLKYKEIKDFVSKGSCNPLGEFFTRNGGDAERRILRRGPTDIQVEEIGSLRLRDLTADAERSCPVKRSGNARGRREVNRFFLWRRGRC